jgi:hypothetical protein
LVYEQEFDKTIFPSKEALKTRLEEVGSGDSECMYQPLLPECSPAADTEIPSPAKRKQETVHLLYPAIAQ